nr:MAG TPA: hypothetical protein [Caudoviricetes sp.]
MRLKQRPYPYRDHACLFPSLKLYFEQHEIALLNLFAINFSLFAIL